MTSTSKASRTRKARSAFLNVYGTETANVVKMILQGKDNWTISDDTWVSVSSIAAYRANVTRGTYDNAFAGCNW